MSTISADVGVIGGSPAATRLSGTWKLPTCPSPGTLASAAALAPSGTTPVAASNPALAMAAHFGRRLGRRRTDILGCLPRSLVQADPADGAQPPSTERQGLVNER